MIVNKILHIILIFTLALQLLPTSKAGRFFMFDRQDEECMKLTDFSKNQLRSLDEENHKDIHIENPGILLHFSNNNITSFHYSELIPPDYYGTIHTPPPNFFA